MPIVASDIKFKLAIKTGSAGNSQAQGDPNESLGKYISTTEVSAVALNNLFNNVTGDVNEAMTPTYRAVFIHNSHATLALQTPFIWISGVRFTAEADDDVFTSAGHGLSNGMVMRLAAELATDVLPGGFDDSTDYYVVGATTDNFQLSLTLGGAAINVSVDGTGAARKNFGCTEAIGVDPTAASAIGSASAQGVDIASDTVAPVGVTFSAPTTKAGGISFGSLPAGQCRMFWIRRTPTNSAAKNNDGLTVKIRGDTAE